MLNSVTVIEENTLRESSPQVSEDFQFRTACTNIQDYPCHFFPWHWHEDVEILYVVDGKLCVKIPNKQFILSKGDIIIIPSNVLHSTEAVGDSDGFHNEYIFSPEFIGGSWNSIIMQKYVIPVVKGGFDHLLISSNYSNYAQLVQLLEEIFDLAKNETDGFELHIHHLMEEVWMITRSIALENKKGTPSTFQSQERLYKMLEYIQKNYCDDINLDNIANVAGVSTRECNRCFKNSLGTSTMEYLLEFRINQASRLLIETTLPITTIGQNCGFSSASYFTKRFREKTGYTPKQYRATERII